MTLYGISGTFRVAIEAESEEEAFEILDKMLFVDLDRVDCDVTTL